MRNTYNIEIMEARNGCCILCIRNSTCIDLNFIDLTPLRMYKLHYSKLDFSSIEGRKMLKNDEICGQYVPAT